MTFDVHVQHSNRSFWLALAANFVWINVSEVWRYFAIVRPLLQDAFPAQDHIAAVTPAIFASWMVWDTILILAATGFYWMYLSQRGVTFMNAGLAALFFTVTVFGLLWLGVVNMGLASVHLMISAMPLAFLEQVVAAGIVGWILSRDG